MLKYYDYDNAYKQKAKGEKTEEDILDMYRSEEDKERTFEDDANNTLMHIAAKYADVNAIRYLLESGVKVTSINNYGYTTLRALCDGVRSGVGASRDEITDEDAYKAAMVLLEAKVSVMRKDDSGKTVYHVAAERGVYAIIKALVDSGAKITMTDNYGHTVLHAACEGIHYAKNDIPYAEDAFKKARENASKPSGSAGLDRAHQEHLVYTEDRLKEAVKHYEDFFKIVKSLVEYGIDPEEKDNSGHTALDYAVKNDAKKIAAFLKGEYDENNPDSIITGGMTLHQAVKKGDMEAIKAIAASGIDINEVNTEEYGEFQDQTPLAVACVQVNPAAVQVLLDAGADPNFKSGVHGRSAIYYFIHRAASNINSNTYKNKDIQHILKSLATAGLNINDYVDDESNTAFIEACRISSGGRINSNSFDGLLIETLLNMGCDVNMANKNGQTALMLMASKDLDTENQFITLLENGAKTDVSDKNGNTPLMYAANNRDMSAAKTYIEIMSQFGDVKPEAVNNQGKTALEIATEHNHEAVVKLLLTL